MIHYIGYRRIFTITEFIPKLVNCHYIQAQHLHKELFIEEWSINSQYPDHVFKNNIAHQSKKLTTSTHDQIISTLKTIASDLLEFRGRHIYVKRDAIKQWADTTTLISPLLLRLIALREKLGPIPVDDHEAARFIKRELWHNIEHSFVLAPFDPAMQNVVESKGLAESHMHLNGTTEPDAVWCYILDRRRDAMAELENAFSKNKNTLSEFIDQIDPGLTIEDLGERLRIARRLRWMLLELCSNPKRRIIFRDDQELVPEHISTLGPSVYLGDCRKNENYKTNVLHTNYLHEILLEQGLPPTPKNIKRLLNNDDFLTKEYDADRPLGESPVSHVGIVIPRTWSRLKKEAVFLYQIIDFLWETPSKNSEPDHSAYAPPFTFAHASEKEMVAHLFYLYGLIWMGNVQALLVQRPEQTGFDQFQKFTIDGLREAPEHQYEERFEQLARYTALPDLTILEGRLAPKNDIEKMRGLLLRIFEGYRDYCNKQRNDEAHDRRRSGRMVGPASMELRLVAHFIKKEDGALKKLIKNLNLQVLGSPLPVEEVHKRLRRLSAIWPACRWDSARKDNQACLSVLLELRKNWPELHRRWVGVDAAANELHAPPEIFAPVFRRARQAGIKGFTCHVGEDFKHIVSGLRAIHEAIHFLDLRNGDRLGHATATGLSPELWLTRMPPRVVLRRGEWLDDLVFAHNCFINKPGYESSALKCSTSIIRQASLVYPKLNNLTPELLYDAWRLRHLDATHLEDLTLPVGQTLYDTEQIKRVRWRGLASLNLYDSEASDVACAASECPEAFRLFHCYHHYSYWPFYEDTIEVDTDFFDERELLALQRHTLALIKDKGLVIETLPTSNLRISFYKEMQEHHIFRWLGFHDPEDKVPVIVGSDDPGIFNTSMRMEYEFLRFAARKGYGKSDTETIRMVDELVEDSHRYAFRTSRWREPEGRLGSLIEDGPCEGDDTPFGSLSD